MPTSPDAPLRPRRPDVIDEVFDGEAVLVQLRTGCYYALDPAASRVWALLQDGARPAELAAALGRESVAAFCGELVAEQLVEEAPSAAPLPDDLEALEVDPGLQRFTDMQDLLMLDPIHDVTLGPDGWPVTPHAGRVTQAFVAGALAAARAAAATTPTRVVDVLLAGVGARVHLVGRDVADELSGGLLATALDGPPEIELWCHAGDAAPPPRPPWGPDDYLERSELRGFTEPPLLAAFDLTHETLSVADTAAGAGVQWFRRPARMAPWEGGAPLRHLLRWTLSAHGAQLLHAAAVGTDAGAALLLGLGGRGKSTTALSCLQSGMAFVADDYCLVRPGPDPTAHPAFAIAKASDASLELLGDGLVAELAMAGPRDWRGKRRLDVTEHVVRSLPLAALVAPRVCARTGAPRRISAHEMLALAVNANVVQFPGDAGSVLGTLRSLCATLPCYELPVGPDVEAVPGALARALAPVTVA